MCTKFRLHNHNICTGPLALIEQAGCNKPALWLALQKIKDHLGNPSTVGFNANVLVVWDSFL